MSVISSKKETNANKDAIREMLVFLNIVGFGTVGLMVIVGLIEIIF